MPFFYIIDPNIIDKIRNEYLEKFPIYDEFMNYFYDNWLIYFKNGMLNYRKIEKKYRSNSYIENYNRRIKYKL